MNIDNSTGEFLSNRFQSNDESTGHVIAISDHRFTAGRRSIETVVSESVIFLEGDRDTFSAEFPVEQNRFRRLADRAVIVPWLRNIRAFCFGIGASLISIWLFCLFVEVGVATRLVISAAIAHRAVVRGAGLDQLTSEWQCLFLGIAIGLALSPGYSPRIIETVERSNIDFFIDDP